MCLPPPTSAPPLPPPCRRPGGAGGGALPAPLALPGQAGRRPCGPLPGLPRAVGQAQGGAPGGGAARGRECGCATHGRPPASKISPMARSMNAHASANACPCPRRAPRPWLPSCAQPWACPRPCPTSLHSSTLRRRAARPSSPLPTSTGQRTTGHWPQHPQLQWTGGHACCMWRMDGVRGKHGRPRAAPALLDDNC